LTLHVDRKIWKSAGEGEVYARYIIAHEIGHIVLHDEFAVAFSDEEAAQLKYLQDEESGEWQANVFAGYFLAPDHIALKLQDADVLAGLCVITDELAAKRLNEAKNSKMKLNPTYEGEMCGWCGSFTLARNGNTTNCDTCGTAWCS
jgi:predicted metalloprotease